MKGHIVKRSAVSWSLKFDIGQDPKTGKRKLQWVTFRGTKKEAQAKLTELVNAVNKKTYTPPARKTVAEFMVQWLASQKTKVDAKTYERIEEIVNKAIVPKFGATKLEDLSAAALEAWYATLLTSGGRSGRPLSDRTVHHYHSVFKRALKAAKRLKMIAANPFEDIDAPSVARKEAAVIDQTEAATILRATEGGRLHIVAALGIYCGMRRGEILGLRWHNVDLEKATLRVAASLSQTVAEGLRFKVPKSDAGKRTIDLGPLVVDLLRRHLVAQKEQRLKVGPVWQDNDLVCCQDDGQPMNPRSITKAFLALALKHGLKIGLHTLRHGHASMMLSSGEDPTVVSRRLGHSKVSITMDIYSHALPGHQKAAAKRLDDVMRTALEQKK